MNYRLKLNLISLLVHIIIFILYTILFFIEINQTTEIIGNYRIYTSILLMIGGSVFLILQSIINKKDKSDERVEKIEYLSATVTGLFMMILVSLSFLIFYVIDFNKSNFFTIHLLWYLAMANISVFMIIFTLSNVLQLIKGSKYED